METLSSMKPGFKTTLDLRNALMLHSVCFFSLLGKEMKPDDNMKVFCAKVLSCFYS